jgi:hypothetical protein
VYDVISIYRYQVTYLVVYCGFYFLRMTSKFIHNLCKPGCEYRT